VNLTKVDEFADRKESQVLDEGLIQNYKKSPSSRGIVSASNNFYDVPPLSTVRVTAFPHA